MSIIPVQLVSAVGGSPFKVGEPVSLTNPLPVTMTGGAGSLASFGINLGTENSYLIQQALDAMYSDGIRSVFVPPVEGGIQVDRANSLFIRAGMMLYGARHTSLIRGVGSPANAPAYPYEGGSLICSARPGTNDRYGVETSRLSSGTGATFNLTVTSGSVTAAAVASGGTGYKTKDEVTVTSGSASCVLTVATVTTWRGPVATVTVKSSTANWGAPSNPYAQASSKGMASHDRVIDVATVADHFVLKDLDIDGGYRYGDAMLTGSQRYGGISLRGGYLAILEGLRVRGFANSGIALRDMKRAYYRDVYGRECGWQGILGTDRNIYSNVGWYLTDPSCSSLNSDDWEVSDTYGEDAIDVILQHTFCGNMRIRDTTLRGAGAIQLEGESSTYATRDTFALNGGIKVPGDLYISNLYADGRMLYGHLAPTGTGAGQQALTASSGFQLISLTNGNENNVQIEGLTGGYCQSYAIKYFQDAASRFRASNVFLEGVNSSSDDSVRAASAVELYNISEVVLRNFNLTEIGSGRGIYVRGRHTKFDADGVVVRGPQSSSAIGQFVGSGVEVDFTQSLDVPSFRLTNYHGSRLLTGMLQVRSNGTANTINFRRFDVSAWGVDCNNHGTTGSRRPIIDLKPNSGSNDGDGNLNVGHLSISLEYAENSILTPSTTPLVRVGQKCSVAASSVLVDVRAPQFDPTTANARLLASVAPTTAPTTAKAPCIGQVAASTTAATIANAYRDGQMFAVSGNNGGVKFTDVIVYTGSGTGVEVVHSGAGFSSPPTRTYTLSGNAIRLALGSGTSTVVAVPIDNV